MRTVDALLDNDVIMKLCVYGVPDAPGCTASQTPLFGILGSAKFVLQKLFSKKQQISEHIPDLVAFISAHMELEPTLEELRLAAELEAEAQLLGLPFDTGESILCAILVQRDVLELWTGDKRAITALETLIPTVIQARPLQARVVCLEQLILRMLRLDVIQLRAKVCARPWLDKALTACFECSSPSREGEDYTGGLTSYIGDLRRRAPTILSP